MIAASIFLLALASGSCNGRIFTRSRCVKPLLQGLGILYKEDANRILNDGGLVFPISPLIPAMPV